MIFHRPSSFVRRPRLDIGGCTILAADEIHLF
jgi:hypothetical protein